MLCYICYVIPKQVNYIILFIILNIHTMKDNQHKSVPESEQYFLTKKEIIHLPPNNDVLRNMFGKLKSQSLTTAYESSLLFKNNQHSLKSLNSMKKILGYGSKQKKLNNQRHFNQLNLQQIIQLQNKSIQQNNSTIDSPTRRRKVDKMCESQQQNIITGKQLAANQLQKVYCNLATKIQTQFKSIGINNLTKSQVQAQVVPHSLNTINLPQINFKHTKLQSEFDNIFKAQTLKLNNKKQVNFNILYIKKNRKQKQKQKQKQKERLLLQEYKTKQLQPQIQQETSNSNNYLTLDLIKKSQEDNDRMFLDNLSTAYNKYRITRQPSNYNQYLQMEIQKNRRIQKLKLFRKENQKKVTNQLLHKKKIQLLKENFEKNKSEQLNIENPETQNYRSQEKQSPISITTSARLNGQQEKHAKIKTFLLKQGSLRKMPSILTPFTQTQLNPQPQIIEQPKFLKGYMSYHPEAKQFYEANKDNLSLQLRLNNFLFNGLGLTAKSYAIFNSETLTPIAYKNYKDGIQVASISKVMTCYLSLLICKKYEINWKTYYVRVTEKASEILGTSAELQRGDVVNIEQLLYGLMLPSGNDASVAIAEALGKIIQKYKKKPTKKSFYQTFVAHMNLLSRQLNLDQQWKNSSGLPSNPNTCTSESICLLTSIAMKDQKFYQIINTKVYETEIKNQMFGLTRKMVWKNTNKLLNDGWQGVKTGTTQTAGHCLLSKKQKYLISVYDCQTLSKRFTQCQALYNLIKKNQHAF